MLTVDTSAGVSWCWQLTLQLACPGVDSWHFSWLVLVSTVDTEVIISISCNQIFLWCFVYDKLTIDSLYLSPVLLRRCPRKIDDCHMICSCCHQITPVQVTRMQAWPWSTKRGAEMPTVMLRALTANRRTLSSKDNLSKQAGFILRNTLALFCLQLSCICVLWIQYFYFKVNHDIQSTIIYQ